MKLLPALHPGHTGLRALSWPEWPGPWTCVSAPVAVRRAGLPGIDLQTGSLGVCSPGPPLVWESCPLLGRGAGVPSQEPTSISMLFVLFCFLSTDLRSPFPPI